MVDQSLYDIDTLRAYSKGMITAREACEQSLLMHVGELVEAMADHNLPLPKEEETLDPQISSRFYAFVTGNRYDA